MPKSIRSSKKDKTLCLKVPSDFHEELKMISERLGGMSVSSMIRVLLYSRVEKVKKTGDPKVFLDMDKK